MKSVNFGIKASRVAPVIDRIHRAGLETAHALPLILRCAYPCYVSMHWHCTAPYVATQSKQEFGEAGSLATGIGVQVVSG